MENCVASGLDKMWSIIRSCIVFHQSTVLVTSNFDGDSIKNEWASMETPFSPYKSMRAFYCHGNQSFDPICPKTLSSLSPTPTMRHIKLDQDWPTGFRDIQVKKEWNFCHSRASNSKMSGLIRPKIDLVRAFMPVLVTSNFDDDSIENERASMETPFSHYKTMGFFLDTQGQLTP